MLIHPSQILDSSKMTFFNTQIQRQVVFPLNYIISLMIIFCLPYFIYSLFQITSYNNLRYQRLQLFWSQKNMLRSSISFRSYVENNPVNFVFGGLLISIIYFSTVFYYTERIYYLYTDQKSTMNFNSTIGFILITLSTIGSMSI